VWVLHSFAKQRGHGDFAKARSSVASLALRDDHFPPTEQRSRFLGLPERVLKIATAMKGSALGMAGLTGGVESSGHVTVWKSFLQIKHKVPPPIPALMTSRARFTALRMTTL